MTPWVSRAWRIPGCGTDWCYCKKNNLAVAGAPGWGNLQAACATKHNPQGLSPEIALVGVTHRVRLTGPQRPFCNDQYTGGWGEYGWLAPIFSWGDMQGGHEILWLWKGCGPDLAWLPLRGASPFRKTPVPYMKHRLLALGQACCPMTLHDRFCSLLLKNVPTLCWNTSLLGMRQSLNSWPKYDPLGRIPRPSISPM